MFGTMKATRTVQHSFVAKKPDERVELVASTSLAEDQKDLRGLEVLFEPIFKRMGHRFIPCGHRALPVIPDEAQHINSGGLSADSGNLLMLEALKRRFTQPEIVEQQFRAFAAQCEKTDRINIELDIFDLSSHPAHLSSIMELCQTPDDRGISPAQIRVDS